MTFTVYLLKFNECLADIENKEPFSFVTTGEVTPPEKIRVVHQTNISFYEKLFGLTVDGLSVYMQVDIQTI